MGKRLQLREVTSEERQAVKRLAHSRTAPARAVERAQVVQAALEGATVEELAVGRAWRATRSICGCIALRDVG